MSFRNVVTSFACGGFKGGMNSYPANTLLVPTYRRCYQNFSSSARPMIRSERYIDILLNPVRSTKTKVLNGWKIDNFCGYLTGEQAEKITIKNKGNQLSTIVEDEKGIRSISTSEISDTKDAVSITNIDANRNPRRYVELPDGEKSYALDVSGNMSRLSSDGKLSTYEMCYNPETGMNEFVCVSTSQVKADSVPVSHDFDVKTGVERFSMKANNPINKPVYNMTINK